MLWLVACTPAPDCVSPLGITEDNQNAGDEVAFEVSVSESEVVIDRWGSCSETPDCTFTEHLLIAYDDYRDRECPELVEGWYRTSDPEAGGSEAIYEDSMLELQDWEPLSLISGRVWTRSFYVPVPDQSR